MWHFLLELDSRFRGNKRRLLRRRAHQPPSCALSVGCADSSPVNTGEHPRVWAALARHGGGAGV